MVSALFVLNSSWRCGRRIRIRIRMRMVAMLWSQTRAPLTKVWQLSQGCEVHRDIGGDYRVIWEIADQITRATVNCFLVTCQHRDNINTTEEEGELMQHLADYKQHNNISDVWVNEESRISIMKCQKWYLLGCLHLLKVLIHTLHHKLVQKCDIWVVNKPPAISAPRLNSVKFDMRGLNIYHINQSKQCNTTLHRRCGQLQVELNHFIRIQCTSGLEEF